jgi:hypothetical protein
MRKTDDGVRLILRTSNRPKEWVVFTATGEEAWMAAHALMCTLPMTPPGHFDGVDILEEDK